MTYRYSIFGLTIDSCLELPELIPADGIPDIHVRWGEVPVLLEGSLKSTKRFQARPGCLLFTADRFARLLVSNGDQVLIEKLPGAEDAAVRAFLLGSAMGAILHQRALLPLHASGIKTSGGCVMFCGRPGTGKSTLAGMFVRRGYELHTDDICVIGVDEKGTPKAYPAYPQLKIWGDALETMGDEPSAYPPVQSLPDKFVVPAPRFNREPLTINRIFILSPHDKDSIEITPITGIRKYGALRYQTYRRRFLEGLGATETLFRVTTSIGRNVPLYRVCRPRKLHLLNELVDVLEKHISGGE